MTDFDYPPTHTVTLDQALAAAEERVEKAVAEVKRLEDDDDATGEALAEARQERSDARSQRDALSWAVEEFGGEATVELQAFTATTRSRTLDTVNRVRMGRVGDSELRDWLIAAAIQSAPWADDPTDLEATHEATGRLPPALRDWLNHQLNDLNDLSGKN